MEKHLYNLQEFSLKYQLKTVWGAEVACLNFFARSFTQKKSTSFCLNFYSISLIQKGNITIKINNTPLTLKVGQLLYLSPFQFLTILEASPDIEVESILATPEYYERALSSAHDFTLGLIDIFSVYTLDKSQQDECNLAYDELRHFINREHIYQGEIIQNIIHIIQFLLSELTLQGTPQPHDASHKEEIYRIFVYLASKYFRKERQLKFYADHLNITPTYLSRTVREISGHTVYEYLMSLTYNEACSLLKTTSKTIGEIADILSFHDQAAFSNFFKQRAGMCPNSFRK